MTHDIVLVTFNRQDEVKELIASFTKAKVLANIFIIDNNPCPILSKADFNNSNNIYYIPSGANLGVAGGRNFGINSSNSDLIIFLDDDIAIDWDQLSDISDKFDSDPQLGILAFKIVNYYDKTIHGNEFPHRNKSLDPDNEFETSYFIGAGHAIHRKVFDQCGLYPDDYFYGLEELDLSFRAIDKGFKILYYPMVTIWHKQSPAGRMPDKRKWACVYRNRLSVAYKYQYRRHLIVLAIIWFYKIAVVSRSFSAPLRGLLDFLDYRKELVRQTVSKQTISKIRSLGGRLWY